MGTITHIEDHRPDPETLAARRIWEALDETQRQGVVHGLIPAEVMLDAGRELDESRLIEELIRLAV